MGDTRGLRPLVDFRDFFPDGVQHALNDFAAGQSRRATDTAISSAPRALSVPDKHFPLQRHDADDRFLYSGYRTGTQIPATSKPVDEHITVRRFEQDFSIMNRGWPRARDHLFSSHVAAGAWEGNTAQRQNAATGLRLTAKWRRRRSSAAHPFITHRYERPARC